MYRAFFKSFLDVVIAFFALLLLLPILLIIYIIVFLNDGENPVFTQERPGKNGKIFKLFKFRTMNSKRDEKGKLLPDKNRLTKLGVALRKSSLDELPQLFNILKGDMSIIGPRPLLIEYLELYTAEQRKRHNVKPGITGWAQVNGRNGISWEQKFTYDVWYVNNLSFRLDIKIFLLTFLKVFKSENINVEGQATTIKFKGNKE